MRNFAQTVVFVGLLAGLALLSTTACSPQDPQNTLAAVGQVARKQQELFWTIFWWAVGVFVVVEGLLVFTVWRFRRRPGQPEPAQVHGNTRLELAWTIAPTLVLASIAVPTVVSIFDLADTPPVALRVNVTGHQWWWEFQYPDLGVVTANELHLPVGEAVALTMESVDVIHSFWVPKLAGKQDIIPGSQRKMWLRGDSPGEFYAQCAELCGIQHANMKFRVKVQSREDFNRWVRDQRTPPGQPSGDEVRGQQVFANVANQCITCHTIDGVPGAAGRTGPNLTHFGARGTLAAGMVDNTPQNLAAWLRNPDEIKPGNLMAEQFKRANIRLSEQDISALVTYLQSLK